VSLPKRIRRPVVLVFVRHYLPGYKFGGPVRSIANMVDHLGDEFDFRVVTSDRDLGDPGAYSGVTPNAWTEVGKARVNYLSPEQQGFGGFARLMRQTPHDVVYLNSFFDAVFAAVPLILRRFGLVPRKPCVVAPRGEFSPGALTLKAWKKMPYLRAVRAGRLVRDSIWQASSPLEAADIAKTLDIPAARICVAPDPSPPDRGEESALSASHRESGVPLRVLFLSRISPKKNLHFALRVIRQVREPVAFYIYGPVSDEAYLQICRDDIASLPKHITAAYLGGVPQKRVHEIMSRHDLFFLPTLGENYGHVIAEALSAGTPVLITNTTPWRDLEAAGVGWDLSLESEQPFVSCIEHCARLGAEDYAAWRETIRDYGVKRSRDPSVIDANRALVLRAVAEGK
jgi:glycosyltransferase involved in cell wall biosynthesis